MELQLERRERIMAPLPLVWEELDSLDRLLGKTAYLADHVLPGGDRASAKITLSWGPLKQIVDLDVTLLGALDHRQIRYAIEAPRLNSRLEGAIDLIPLGRSETMLDHRGAVDVEHRLAARMRGQLEELTEQYADTIVERVKTRAENRRHAQERLLP
jgi:hypothetical protein